MSDRFAFANQLRGFAAICVVIDHLAGVYWSEPQLVADATFSAVQQGSPPAFSWLAASEWHNLGPFGVAVFFLISGFVIPMSLGRQSSIAFLVARAFRIYPTYLVAFALELMVIAASAAHWHRPMTYGLRSIVANASLTTDIANIPSIDLVNWTLIVELKFYFLMAVLAAPVRQGNLTAIFGVAASIVGVTAYSHQIFLLVPQFGSLLRIFESNALYVLFMLIGVVFNFHARRLVSNAVGLAAVAALFALFVVCWPLTFFRGEFPAATLNYGWALLLFGASYLMRSRIRELPIGAFFASVSYPLYLVHALVGFTVLKFMIVAWHVDTLAATAVAIGVSVAIAYGLHLVVERPSQLFGKRIASKI